MIYTVDVASIPDEDLPLNTLPDGSLAANYATMQPESSSGDMQSFLPMPKLQIWFSGSCYVMKFGDQVEWNIISKDQPMFVTCLAPECCGKVGFIRL
jgi:hypothetical protein